MCVKLREAGLQADGQSARAGEPLEGRWGHPGSGGGRFGRLDLRWLNVSD